MCCICNIAMSFSKSPQFITISQSILRLTGYSTAVTLTFILNKHILLAAVLRDAVTRLVALAARYRDMPSVDTSHWISSHQHSTIYSTDTNTAISCSAWLEHGAFVLAAKSGTSPLPSRGRGREGDEGATITLTTTAITTASTLPLSQFHHNHCVL